MNTITIVVECPESSAEVPPMAPARIESLLEEAVGLLLMELFQEVIVHEVTVRSTYQMKRQSLVRYVNSE